MPFGYICWWNNGKNSKRSSDGSCSKTVFPFHKEYLVVCFDLFCFDHFPADIRSSFQQHNSGKGIFHKFFITLFCVSFFSDKILFRKHKKQFHSIDDTRCRSIFIVDGSLGFQKTEDAEFNDLLNDPTGDQKFPYNFFWGTIFQWPANPVSWFFIRRMHQ